MLAAGLLELRRLPGVLRPAIVQPLPSWKGPIVVLDIGATPDPRPNQLHQFAHMGTAFSASVLGVHEPRVGLLSNGHEEGKGNRLVLDSYRLLADDARLRFAGNIEGRDSRSARSTSSSPTASPATSCSSCSRAPARGCSTRSARPPRRPGRASSAACCCARSSPAARQDQPRDLRRPYLIGLRAIAVKAHGDSGSVAISNALRHAARGVREGLIEDIARRVHPEPRAADTIAAPRHGYGRDRRTRQDRRRYPPTRRAHATLARPHTALYHGGTLATREEVLDQVKQILVQQLGVDEGQVTPEASFQDDLDADSLDLVELIMELEDQFGVKIPDEEAQGIKTVNQAVDYIMENAS